jgi:alpha-tubulin suppressor-like RCC1 family protein
MGWVDSGRSWGGLLRVFVVVVGLVIGLVGLASRAEAAPFQFASVSAGDFYTCGVRTDETVVCWGENQFGQSSPPAGMFKSVSAGSDHTCGVRANETVVCWGDNRYGQS